MTKRKAACLRSEEEIVKRAKLKWHCAPCAFDTDYGKDYNRHLKSKCHQKLNPNVIPVFAPSFPKVVKDLLIYLYTCEKCNYGSNNACNYETHVKSLAHYHAFGIPIIFTCVICEFESNVETVYQTHLNSTEHVTNLLPLEQRQKACTQCFVMQNFTEFHKQTAGMFHLQTICKACSFGNEKQYFSTVEGCMKCLANNARSCAKQRAKNGRVNAGICTITKDFLIGLWNKQKGKCYYSGIAMNLEAYSDWKCSLERLNREEGDIEENVALVCNEFNGSSQWSIEKIERIIEKIIESDKADLDHIKMCIQEICACNQFKCMELVKHRKNKGKACSDVFKTCCVPSHCKHDSGNSEKVKADANALRIKLHQLVSNAVINTKRRIAKDTKAKKIDMTMTLTFEELLAQYEKQEGKCAYSGILMNIQSKSDWMMSLERANTQLGYRLSNIVLICLEFNTLDLSALSDDPDSAGSCAWSKEKFQYFMQQRFPMFSQKPQQLAINNST